ncbi:MAG TPA: amidohydrolase family protein [Pyrinomonadaceae bacterium]|nr:amidohydrolase family protein [Pyrinomonadaceae bacterium]
MIDSHQHFWQVGRFDYPWMTSDLGVLYRDYLPFDHMAKPPIARNEIKEWSQALAPLAKFLNIHCKLSGLVTEANWTTWQADDLRPFVDYALELFGVERMMFGSDYPVCLLAASYDRVLEAFQEILKDLSDGERDQIFSKNAARFYRLN